MNSNFIYDVVIVGAGISGLAAGKYLSDRGLSVKILDKGKAVGGRLATKRMKVDDDKIQFDYGARFIEARDSEFKAFINNLIDDDIAKIWHVGNYSKGSNEIDLSAKYSGKKSMREIAFYLSEGLNVSSETKVESIRWENDNWVIKSQDARHKSKALIVTMPNPQALELLGSSEISIPRKIHEELETVRYEKTITALLILDGKSGLNGEGGINFKEGPLAFITDNNLKGISSGSTAVTVEMSHSFSSQYWDSAEAELAGHIVTLAGSFIESNVTDYHIHRWRYSKPSNYYSKRFELLEHPGPLYLAGDSFLGNNIESAYLSGIHAARNLYDKYSYQFEGVIPA